MEQRCSMRKLLTLDTVLSCPGLGLVSGKSRDIGLEGMYVETGRIQVPSNSTINVSLIFNSPDRKHVQVDASVMRCDEMGVGLQFSRLDLAMQDILRVLVFGEFGVDDDMLSALVIH